MIDWKQDEIRGAPDAGRTNEVAPMKMLRKPELEAKTGLCERAIRDLEQVGVFPKRVLLNPLGGRAVAWVEEEIDAYLRERAAAREVA